MNGFWTSADHILCNPVEILKSYLFEPLVAGSYQDDDPAYANSDFNDFSRIDGFDSDLWNNDARFTPEERGDGTGDLDIDMALKDARAPAVAEKKVLTVPTGDGKPFRPMPRRFMCLKEQNLEMSQLYEYKWLLHAFGLPSIISVEHIEEHPDPDDCPIVIVQRPHAAAIAKALRRWEMLGKKFYVLHLSDEMGEDPLDLYEMEGCVKVMRMYLRDTPCPEKVLTIPLGYHWTLAEGSKNPLTLTPRLPFRENVWSFHGTDWKGRKELLAPLKEVGPHVAEFYEGWNSEAALKEEAYISVLLNTVFVPCPDGMNPETFRFYEALECGCLPLIVRTEANEAWVSWIAGKCKIIPMNSWDDAKEFVKYIIGNKEQLEGYRNVVLEAWIQWREEVRREGVKWLE